MNDTIGIDISKDTLDAFWLSKRKHKQFANNKAGLRALIRWVRKAEVSLVVFEATGVYHRLLETGLATQGIAFARVNPRQARRFAEGTGQLAKTDRVDAAILARMGSLLELGADQPGSSWHLPQSVGRSPIHSRCIAPRSSRTDGATGRFHGTDRVLPDRRCLHRREGLFLEKVE